MNDKTSQTPGWDGNPATFLQYRRRARRYVESTKRSERYLCGPRLENRLTDKAETAVERCRPGWLSIDQGAERLLAFLEQKCGSQAVPDVGNRLTMFFFKLRRKRGEHMGAWCMRHRNEYEELRKALVRVEGGTTKRAAGSKARTLRRSSAATGASVTYIVQEPIPEEQGEEEEEAEAEDEHLPQHGGDDALPSPRSEGSWSQWSGWNG